MPGAVLIIDRILVMDTRAMSTDSGGTLRFCWLHFLLLCRMMRILLPLNKMSAENHVSEIVVLLSRRSSFVVLGNLPM